MLEIKELEASYSDKDIRVLKGINLNIKPNTITSIIGPNGSGKSTLLKCITGLLKISRGEIKYKGENIENLPTYLIIKKGISYVPQGRHIFPSMTVKENLEIGGYLIRSNKKLLEERLKKVFEIFPVLNNKNILSKKSTFLSGGEQQLVLLARSLMIAREEMNKPDLILLDEPSLGLQPTTIKTVYDYIKKIKELKNPNNEPSAVVLVDQNVTMALLISDYFYVLNDGKIVYEGEPKDININELKKAYFQI